MTEPVSSAFKRAFEQYDNIQVIIAPPRTCSTLLARILWAEPTIAFYAHEPFDVIYHCAGSVHDALERLRQPVDLAKLPGYSAPTGNDLLIKDLSFQIGRYFPLLAGVARLPIMFTVRDPRLTVRSRMRQRMKNGREGTFPPRESGWTELVEQIAMCRARRLPYFLVDGDSLQRAPEILVKRICAELGFTMTRTMLRWRPCAELSLGLSLPEQNSWNEQVLGSSGVDPPREAPPDVSWFPATAGLRDHVAWAVAAYEELRRDPRMLTC